MTGGRVTLNARITPPPAMAVWTPPALMQCEGENCPCTRGRPVHPPVLMTFDAGSGEYRPAQLRCVAVWAANSGSRVPGQICGQHGTHQIADVVVCEHHYRRIREWAKDWEQRERINAVTATEGLRRRQAREDGEVIARQMARRAEAAAQEAELAREAARLQRELDRQRILAEDAARAELSVVYFIVRESDGLIKIGTTRSLAQRAAGLKRKHGALRLMATIGGTHKQETELHRRFKALRVAGEWFRPELPLLEYVYAVMKNRPVQEAPGLPPIVARKEIGSMIWHIKMAPVLEQRRQAAEFRELRREVRKRRLTAAQASAGPILEAS